MVHTSIETCFSSELSKRNDTRVHVHTQCAMERPVARGGGVPSDDVGPAPGPAAHSLSPEALEAHVQAACDALRSGGTFGVLDLRGHPDAGAAIDTILASAEAFEANFREAFPLFREDVHSKDRIEKMK